MGSDVVNDIDGARDPSFVHVAICTGSSIDSEPVTLVDRLCLNGPAVEVINDNYSICIQENKAYVAEVAQLTKERDESEFYGKIISGAWVVMFIMFVIAARKAH